MTEEQVIQELKERLARGGAIQLNNNLRPIPNIGSTQPIGWTSAPQVSPPNLTISSLQEACKQMQNLVKEAAFDNALLVQHDGQIYAVKQQDPFRFQRLIDLEFPEEPSMPERSRYSLFKEQQHVIRYDARPPSKPEPVPEPPPEPARSSQTQRTIDI